MPRYFFHLQNGETFRDEEGVDLDNLAAAQTQAAQTGSQMLADGRDTFWRTAPWNIIVADNAGVTVSGIEMSVLPNLLNKPVA